MPLPLLVVPIIMAVTTLGAAGISYAASAKQGNLAERIKQGERYLTQKLLSAERQKAMLGFLTAQEQARTRALTAMIIVIVVGVMFILWRRSKK